MTARLFALTLALCSLACMKPNPLIYTLGESETGSESETGNAETSSDGNTPISADLPYGSCDAAAPYQAACATCMAESCCELATACESDEDCMCLASCSLAGGNIGTCKSECGVTKPNEVPHYQALLDCASNACAGACG